MTNNLKNVFNEGMTYMVIPHTFPDGDAIGSCYAMLMYLKSIGAKAYIVCDEEIPREYKFLYTEDYIRSDEITEDFDYAVMLDFGDFDRAACDEELFSRGKKIINIDHHVTNKLDCDYKVLKAKSSSTGEVLFEILKSLGHKISKEEAKGIYTAIVTDTGKFMYSNTSANTLRVVSELYETGFDVDFINVEIYQNKSKQKLDLFNMALNNLQIHDDQIATMTLSYEEVDNSDCDFIDSDGIVEAGRDIENIQVSALFKEVSPGKVKVSLRSKNKVMVNKIALKYGGGGHNKAAGCTIMSNIDKAKELIVKDIQEEL